MVGVAKALAQGIAGKVKTSLDSALKLQPKHADAHIALGAYHAEIIGKVGSLVGGLTAVIWPESANKLPERASTLVVFALPEAKGASGNGK